MITPFDALLPVGILLALLLSAEPKRTAISIVILATLAITFYDYMFDGLLPYQLAVITESIAGIFLVAMSKRIFHSKLFFYAMSLLLFSSATVTTLYIYDFILLHTDYVTASQTIAFSHLVVMLTFSDGVHNFVGSLHDRIASLRLYISRI